MNDVKKRKPDYLVRRLVIRHSSDGHEDQTEEIVEIPESQHLLQQVAWRQLWRRLLDPRPQFLESRESNSFFTGGNVGRDQE